MPRNTNQGKAYTLEELIRLGTINSFGPYNNAVTGALMESKTNRIEKEKLEEENKRLKSLLDEALHAQYIKDVRNGK
jgi:hypothetical protein